VFADFKFARTGPIPFIFRLKLIDYEEEQNSKELKTRLQVSLWKREGVEPILPAPRGH
jgi:hypothetical protein